MSPPHLKEAVYQAAREYYRSAFLKTPFIPGKSIVPVSGKVLDEADLEALLDATLDLWLTGGRHQAIFEKSIAEPFSNKIAALFVNSGSSANLVAISSLGSKWIEKLGMKPLSPGDEVISVATSFPTTISPILQSGWVPVLVDVDLTTLNALPDAIEAAWSPKTRAVVLAHTLGNPFEVDRIGEFCKKRDLFLIEDCCDALGSFYQGRSVGTTGHYATCSFYPAHHITTGEGGAILSKNIGLRRIAESIRDWGRDCYCASGHDNTCKKRFEWQLGDLPAGYDHKYTYSNLGFNLKATDMQAALGVSQLKKLPKFVEKRASNYAFLLNGIQTNSRLSSAFTPVLATQNSKPSWFGFPLHCNPGVNRNKVIRYLEDHLISTRLVFGGNLLRQPAFKDQNIRAIGPLTHADRVMNQTFWLGVFPGIGTEELSYVLEHLEKATQL